jgi:hypothetical protein
VSDIEGDPSKRPPECKTATMPTSCPHLKEVGGGMSGERYACEVCGQRFFLDYDEMR